MSLYRERAEVTGGASPKFIVTLDGVPSPLASRTDQEMEPEDEFNVTSDLPGNDRPKPAVHLRLGTELLNANSKMSNYRRVMKSVSSILNSCRFCADGEMDEEEDMDVSPDQTKRQKLQERCKFWPTCKTGDECLYHHPNTQCK